MQSITQTNGGRSAPASAAEHAPADPALEW